MTAKEIVIYASNVLLILGAFVLVWQKVITWEMAAAFAAALLFPSAGHAFLNNRMKK